MDKTPDGVVALDVNGLSVNSSFYVLHLYITGATPNSTRAVRNVKEICETYLKGRYELIIIDIYQQPMLAEADQIIAAPTLVKKQPLPIRRLIGDMSDRDRVLSGLGIVS
jgi:circadian clock protein KaiB